MSEYQTELLARDVVHSPGARVAGALRPATTDDLVAHLAAQPDGGDALLRELLRSDPDRAVRVVDESQVARGWSDGIRETLGRTGCAPGEVAYSLLSRGWYVHCPLPSVRQDYDGQSAAESAADAALHADGWVLAGVTP